MSVYGPLVTIEDVRLALTAHLRTWSPAYLAEVGRQRSVTLEEFRGYTTSTGDEFPVCLTAAASVDAPMDHGDGTVTASFSAAAAAVVSGATREEATALASYYGAAIRGAVLQHPDLSGFASGCDWTGEAIEEVAFDTGQAIVACTVRFTVDVDGVIDMRGGPLTAPVDPTADPGDWPHVVTTAAPIERLPN